MGGEIASGVQCGITGDQVAEVVEVTFNKNLISLEELIVHYLESHDPTQLNRQGNDIGTQYRSIVLYTDRSQERKISELISKYQILLSAIR